MVAAAVGGAAIVGGVVSSSMQGKAAGKAADAQEAASAASIEEQRRQFDAYRNKFARTWRPGGNKNPLHRLMIAIGTRQMRKERMASQVQA